jgi:hypothetical protein
MLLLRVAFLEFLICFYVIGAAVLFRRFFPRESPWFAFIIPTLALLMGLNFIEHFIPLTNVGWLLPITVGGLFWSMVKPGYSWNGLRLPSILFVLSFTFVLLLKCLSPDIPNYTEGTGNMTRVLNYCLGGTLPPVDCFLPPYDYGGYYSFQQYGAAIIKRLFVLDLGTAYNLGFAFLLAWVVLIGAGVAHAITGKAWIASSLVMILLAGSTGSVLFFVFSSHPIDYGLSTDPNDAWDDHVRNPFWWFSSHDQFHSGLKLLPPTYTLYYSEFHANLGGVFVTIASLLASVEVFRIERSNWPWVCLIVFPMLVIITSAWFFFIVLFFCAGSLVLAWLGGRRPQDLTLSGIASLVGLVFVWPSFFSLAANPATQNFYWTPPDGRTPLWMFLIQWWPVYLPWLFLCFVWHKLDLMSRWIHAAIPLLFLWVEFTTFGDRGLTVEKMWGGIYGAGLVTLVPMVFVRRHWLFRGLSTLIFVAMFISLGAWVKTIYYDPVDKRNFFRLQGDNFVQNDPQARRLLQVLSRLHGATILPGESTWAYNEAPAVIGFSENRCYVAYFHQEDQAGHGGEAQYRNDLNNSFYAGTMTDPLSFLHSNDIAAVLIWPEDKISDQLLQQFQNEIGAEYYYINCKVDGANNAGVFMRQSASAAGLTPIKPMPLDLAPHPQS